MRQRCCDWEHVFEFICNDADRDGIWDGDAAIIAVKFRVSEDEAGEMLSDLADRGLVEHLYPGTYAITKWPEQYDLGEEELL